MMAYLKRVTPIYGAYKPSRFLYWPFFGCGMCPAVSESRRSQLDDGIVDVFNVGPAVISPLMELVEFGADLRNLAVRMDQIEDVMKMEPIAEGTCDTRRFLRSLAFRM